MEKIILKFGQFGQQLSKKWKHILSLFLISIFISAGALIAPSIHPANAFAGLLDVECCNLQEIAEDLLESFAESFTEAIVKTEVSKTISSTINQYHVGSYLAYAANLTNQVYAAQAIANDGKTNSSVLDQYIVKSIINDIQTNPVQKVNLNPLYAQAATDVFNIQNTQSVTVGVGAQNYLASSGSFGGNAGGQYLMYMDLSEKLNSSASAAAQHDISTATGYKSTYNCTQAAGALGESLSNNANDNGNNASTSASGQQQAQCALQNPGNYVGTLLAGSVQGLFNREVNPPNNHLSAITGLASMFGSIAAQQLVGGSVGGTLVSATVPVGQSQPQIPTIGTPSTGLIASETAPTYTIPPITYNDSGGTGSGNVEGTSNSNYGTLYALDSNGNVIAGSGTTQSQKIAKKSEFTVEWNAAEITGASYVAFAPCKSAECSGSKDKKQLDGSVDGTMSGAVKTYTLQVWGLDQNGNITILETDTIALKAQ